jgi:hypothetical protein
MNAGRMDVIDEIYAPDLAPAGSAALPRHAQRLQARLGVPPIALPAQPPPFIGSGSDDPADAADGVVLLF